MPELSIEYYYHCITSEHFSKEVKGSKGNTYTVTFGKMPNSHRGAQHDWSCTCPSFQYRGKCKHIEQVKPSHCGWMQFISGGEPKNGKCPECGSDVKSMGWGV